MHKVIVSVAETGHTFDPLILRDVVAASLVRLGTDTLGPRLVKAMRRSAPEPAGLLERLMERLEAASGDASGWSAEARTWASDALEVAARKGLTVLTCFDASYPPWLAEIPDPPIALWLRGEAACLPEPAVAVVGSRQATPAGLAVARRLGRELTRAGLVVVSGLARGVDAAAHEGALDEAGRTVAVLGCGVDVTYPREHRPLVARIAESGAVISEFPPGMPPLSHHFPLRNRIISGLSRAVVVIEASDRSGSLITAKAAMEQGRDVLAVPGSVPSGRSRGCHALIKDGARLVETVEDILDELGWHRPGAAASPDVNTSGLSDLELTMAAGEPYSVDELAARTGRQMADLLAELATLELGGKVSRVAGGAFIRLDESAIGGERAD